MEGENNTIACQETMKIIAFSRQVVAIAFLPEPGRGIPVLLGLIVLAGFVLEGLRMAMTGWPNRSQRPW